MTSNDTQIDILYKEASQIARILAAQNETSLEVAAMEKYRKVLLLSCASWFEHRLSEAVKLLSEIQSNGHAGIKCIIRVKAVDRQFHTWFGWKELSAGPFYKLFGECGEFLKAYVQKKSELKEGEKSFMLLGQLRNELVHQNFAVFPLELTADEVYSHYIKAEKYIGWLEAELAKPEFGRTQEQ